MQKNANTKSEGVLQAQVALLVWNGMSQVLLLEISAVQGG